MDKRIRENVKVLQEVAREYGLTLTRRKGNGHQQWELRNDRGEKRLCTVAVSPSDPNYLKKARRDATRKAQILSA